MKIEKITFTLRKIISFFYGNREKLEDGAYSEPVEKVERIVTNEETVVVHKSPEISKHEKLLKLFSAFQSQFNDLLTQNLDIFFFYESDEEEYCIVEFFSQFAVHTGEIRLLFSKEPTIKFAAFRRDDYEYGALFEYALRKMPSSKYDSSGCKHPSISHFYGEGIYDIYGDISIPNQSRKDIRTMMAVKKLMSTNCFENIEEIAAFIINEYAPFISSLSSHEYLRISRNLSKICRVDGMEELKYEELYTSVVNIYKANGFFTTKWKSEFLLYTLICSYFPDAIYQYRDAWLERQSLDIFIPSLNVGVEYQGQQHYAPVDYFGGEENFIKNKKRDQIKKEKCLTRGVRLIEWPYEIPVAERYLIEVFKENGISLPKEKIFVRHKTVGTVPQARLFIEEQHLNCPVDINNPQNIEIYIERKDYQVVAVMLYLYSKTDEQYLQQQFVMMTTKYKRIIMEAFLEFADDTKADRIHDVFGLIAKSKIIRSYYLDGLRTNYVTRRLLTKMVQVGIPEKEIVENLQQMKAGYKGKNIGEIWETCYETDTIEESNTLKRLMGLAKIPKPKGLKEMEKEFFDSFT